MERKCEEAYTFGISNLRHCYELQAKKMAPAKTQAWAFVLLHLMLLLALKVDARDLLLGSFMRRMLRKSYRGS